MSCDCLSLLVLFLDLVILKGTHEEKGWNFKLQPNVQLQISFDFMGLMVLAVM